MALSKIYLLLHLFQTKNIEETINNTSNNNYETDKLLGDLIPITVLIIIALMIYYYSKKRNNNNRK